MTALPHLRALHALHESLTIENTWSLWSDSGFVWWPGILRQRIRCSDPLRDGSPGVDRFQLFVETEVLTGVAPSDGLADRLATINRIATLSGLVWRQETGSVSLVASQTVDRELHAAAERQLAMVALLQMHQAHQEAAAMQRYLGGRIAASEHPEKGPRPRPHALATEVAGQVQPKGILPSAWSEPGALALIAACLERDGAVVRLRGDELGVAIPYSGVRCCTLRVSAVERHPSLGAGLYVRLTVPEHRDQAGAAELAVVLNAIESLSCETHYQGAWTHVNTTSGWAPAFVRFLPNAAHDPGIAARLVDDCLRRSAWLAEEFFDVEPAATAKATLQ